MIPFCFEFLHWLDIGLNFWFLICFVLFLNRPLWRNQARKQRKFQLCSFQKKFWKNLCWWLRKSLEMTLELGSSNILQIQVSIPQGHYSLCIHHPKKIWIFLFYIHVHKFGFSQDEKIQREVNSTSWHPHKHSRWKLFIPAGPTDNECMLM